MRVDALHRRIEDDVRLMHEAVLEVLPVQMPTQYLTRAMSVRAFVDRLNGVTSRYGVFNEIQPDTAVEPGQVIHTGLWIGEDELPENDSEADIRVMWHLHPTTKRVQMTQPEWHRRRYYWWQMVMHELVHRYQDTYRTKDQKIRVFRPWTTQRDQKVEQEYYGNYDEIETHSHDAAVELVVWWGHLSLREAIYQAATYSGRLIMPTYNCFVSAFLDSPGHPAMRIFKRKLRTWYKVIKANPDIYQLLELPKLIT